MEERKAVMIGLVILALALAGAAGFEFYQNLQLKEQLDTQKNALADNDVQLKKLQKDLRRALRDGEAARAELASKGEAPKTDTASDDNASSDGTTDEAQQTQRQQNRNRGGRNFAELLKTPAGKLMAKGMMNRQYGDLFKKLKLTDAEKAQLQQLLTEQETARMQARANRQNATPQDAAQLAEQQKALAAQMQSLLGSQYKTLETYNEQLPQRNVVNQADAVLSLSSDQKEKMVQILSDSQKSGGDSQQVNQNAINQLGTVLTPEQLQDYTTLQSTFGQRRGGGFGGGPPPGM